jgi:hypothetical protein
MGSVTHILMNCYDNNVANTKVLFSTHIASNILEQLSVVSIAANESIRASLSKQTESSCSSYEMGHLTTSYWWLGLAIFKLGLPRSCC